MSTLLSRIFFTLALSLLGLPLATGTASQSGSRSAALPVELTRSGYHVDVRIGGRPFTTYSFDPSVAKPYLSPLRSAQGTVITRAFPRTFKLALMEKDVTIAAEFARENRVPAPLTQMVAELLRVARRALGEEADHVETVKLIESWAGCEVSG